MEDLEDVSRLQKLGWKAERRKQEDNIRKIQVQRNGADEDLDIFIRCEESYSTGD